MTYTSAELYYNTNSELRNICRNLGLVGYSKKTKDELVNMIISATENESSPSPEENIFAIIASGCTRTTMPVAGMSISEVISSYQEIFNIPDNASALVCGKTVSGSYVVKAGDNIEFIKPAGKKGATYSRGELEDMTCNSLRTICRDLNLTGYSKTRKEYLVDMILEVAGGPETTSNANAGAEDNIFAIIASGCTRTTMPVAGMSISEIISSYQEIFNIPDNASALVCGKTVSGSYVVKPGDNIEFIKPAGKKG